MGGRGWWLFGGAPGGERRRLAEVLRGETVGGLLLMGAAAVAVAWANSPWAGAYRAVRDLRVGPAAVGLRLSLAQWAADGLLAVFFFVAGLELKREFVAGELRDPRRAAVPVVAALCGVAVPAGLYLLVNSAHGGAPVGWAVPAATDIAFALAVLALVGRQLPAAVRTFLLTLAVVDDLCAIAIIAVAYTRSLHWLPLLVALVPLGAFALAVRRGVTAWWLLVPLAVVTWALVHESGVHATVAGVLLAFTVPAAGEHSLAERFEHRWRPVSAGLAVPAFALLASGVRIGGRPGLVDAVTDPAAWGVVAGLVLGKPLGVLAGTWLAVKATGARLGGGLDWLDVTGVALLSGVGFTVSLLVGELAFGSGTPRDEHVKLAILTGSLLAAATATLLLRARARHYHRLTEAGAEADGDGDGDGDGGGGGG